MPRWAAWSVNRTAGVGRSEAAVVADPLRDLDVETGDNCQGQKSQRLVRIESIASHRAVHNSHSGRPRADSTPSRVTVRVRTM